MRRNEEREKDKEKEKENKRGVEREVWVKEVWGKMVPRMGVKCLHRKNK